MDATDWTTPDAYAGQDDEDFMLLVADATARRMYRAFERVGPPLDRAAWRTRSTPVRAEIDTAMTAMVAATARHDVLTSILRTDRAVGLADTLSDLCRALHLDRRPGTAPPALDLCEEAAATMARPQTAWAIAAAVVEMADEVGGTRPLQLKAQFIQGHLAVVVGEAGRRHRPVQPHRLAAEARSAGGRTPATFLDRIAGLLLARVVRGIHGHGRGIAIVMKVRLGDMPNGGRP